MQDRSGEDAPAPSTGDMPPAEFRRLGHEVVDWIARYLEEIDRYPVFPDIAPGWVRDRLPEVPPEAGESPDRILADFRQVVVPAVTHWNHPSFHGYFAVTGSGPGILGEMLSAALNINAMVWRSSPAGTELEEHVLDWLRQMLGLPPGFMGVINDTASTSSLIALAAAREAGLPEARDDGLFGAPRGRIYASAEAHSSIDKAGITLGFGRSGVRHVEADERFRMRPAALRAAIEQDLAEGVRPIAVVATVGTTSTTSVDPVPAVADLAEEYGLWLHVDAAYAGAAALVPELAPAFEGWERADSIVVNPHKWLFTPVDCSVLYSRRPEVIRAAFSVTPEYLKTQELGVGTNLMDYGVALGRRFRALKLWFVLRYFGREGIAARIREHVRLARELAGWVDGSAEWERVAPHPFGTVVFRYAPPGVTEAEADRLNEEIMERVNRSGEAFVSHSKLHGRTVIRLSIGNLKTTEAHVVRTWEALQAQAAALGAGAR
jgi:aromatic-L-amino-acid/L-tryptophan decarboxylase